MKVGDLVRLVLHRDSIGVLISEPRTPSDQDIIAVGIFGCEVYEVVDVWMSWGKDIFTLDEIEDFNESR